MSSILYLMLPDLNLPFDPRLLLFGLPLVLLILLSKKGRKTAPTDYPYTAISLFTPNERTFLQVLRRAAPDAHIFGKVRLADVIAVQQGLPRSAWQRAFNRIASKHLDFVLCDEALCVRCAIELDDSSHQRADRRARDAFLEAALQAARVLLVRVQSRNAYDVAELRALLSVSGTVDEARPAPVERRVDVGAEAV